MNISYNWLKELIDLDMSAGQLADQLTRVGLAVEGIHPHGDDLVLDVDLTSNRPDCLSHLGMAREIGVFTGSSVKQNATTPDIPLPSVLADDVVHIADADLCNRFTARIIRNVKIGPSPKWLADRLEAIGERSINNVADITNYVMHELGQPMHSFDLDKLAGQRIIVRRAVAGETITTLDEVDRKLDETMLAICDAEKPAAVAGIMGGLGSSITEETTNVLLEVAYFTRENIRATSRKLNLASEASYRFERGVDIENLVAASNRAAELICLLAGGEKGEFIDVYPTPARSRTVVSPDISAAAGRLTGLVVPTAECVRILSALGITPSEAQDAAPAVTFVSPTWRHDIAIEEDLVEEVARHAGYENIGTELPPAYGAGEYQANEPREKRIRQTLIDNGFDEAISYSFIDTGHDEAFDTVPGVVDAEMDEKYVTLRDSVIEGAVRMRPTILPGLLDSLRLNFNQQRRDLRIFELGKVFANSGNAEHGPTERELFAFAMTGCEVYEDHSKPGRDIDFYDAKGVVEAVMDAAGAPAAQFRAADVKHLRPGQAADVMHDGIAVGYIGRLSDDIAAKYKFRQPVYIGELNLQRVLEFEPEQIAYWPLPKFPGIVRDVSLIAKRVDTFEMIRNAITGQQHELCRGVDFVDVFEGKGMAADERSITIRLEYRSDDRTLTESEVDELHQQIMSELERITAVRPRF